MAFDACDDIIFLAFVDVQVCWSLEHVSVKVLGRGCGHTPRQSAVSDAKRIAGVVNCMMKCLDEKGVRRESQILC